MVTKSNTDLYKENLQKYFDSMVKIAPQYYITSNTFQEECFKQIEHAIDFSTLAQQDFAKNVKSFNDNVDSYIDLNRTIVQSWIKTLSQE
jgi:hypothetical protein